MKDIILKKAIGEGRPAIKALGGILLTMILVFAPPGTCRGYILPAEQIIGFMAANFSAFKTQIIVQSTTQIKGPQPDAVAPVIREKVWAKSPNLFHSQVLEQGKERGEQPDMAFRQLLVANSPDRIMEFLRNMGVDLKKVSLSRFHKIIVYEIGDREESSPKILIDKERFLPLLLQYRSLGKSPGEGMNRVELWDYRKVDKGWYPFEISYRMDLGIQETYKLETIQTNVPVDLSIFTRAKEEGPTDRSGMGAQSNPSEEGRIRHFIKAGEGKYR